MTYLSERDFFFEVAAGNIPGYSKVSKFGGTHGLGTSMIPITSTGFYRTPTAATALEAVSTDNTNDVAGGSGAREITVIGLQADWTEVTQTVSLNGTTPVALGTDLIRLYRIYVSGSGTYATAISPSHSSVITIQESGAGSVWADIPLAVTGFGGAQSTIGAYTVPLGKTALVYIDDIFVDSAKLTNLFFFQRPNANDITAPYSAMRIVEEIIGVETEVPFSQHVPFGPYVGPTDIGFLGQLQSGSSGDVAVNFDIVLYDT